MYIYIYNIYRFSKSARRDWHLRLQLLCATRSLSCVSKVSEACSQPQQPRWTRGMYVNARTAGKRHRRRQSGGREMVTCCKDEPSDTLQCTLCTSTAVELFTRELCLSSCPFSFLCCFYTSLWSYSKTQTLYLVCSCSCRVCWSSP